MAWGEAVIDPRLKALHEAVGAADAAVNDVLGAYTDALMTPSDDVCQAVAEARQAILGLVTAHTADAYGADLQVAERTQEVIDAATEDAE